MLVRLWGILRPICVPNAKSSSFLRVEVGGFTYKAMLNIGWRPTLDNGTDQTIEAHLLDYEGGALYGQHIKIAFYRRIRDERRFSSIEALQKQLALDADKVREVL